MDRRRGTVLGWRADRDGDGRLADIAQRAKPNILVLWGDDIGQPVCFQFLFATDRAKQPAAAEQGWALKAAAAGKVMGVLASGEAALVLVVTATHSGMSAEAFVTEARAWLAEARHPTTGRRLTAMVYQPMLEVLDHLRANSYATFIVSGCDVDFLRAFAEDAYGVPPANVIGSLGAARVEFVDRVPQVMKDRAIDFIDVKGGKLVAIARHLRRRPVFVAGNSDGDLARPQWATAGEGARFVPLAHHTDAGFEHHRVIHIAIEDARASAEWAGLALPSEVECVWAAREGLVGAEYT